MAKDVVFVISPFLVVTSRNVTLLLSAFDSGRSGLLDDDVLSAVFLGRLSDDQGYCHQSNGFANEPANALLPYLLDIFHHNESETSVPVEELDRLDQTLSCSRKLKGKFIQ